MTSICSLDALDAGEELSGTAPYASAWIVIEQPGGWGRNAINDSELDPAVAAHLAGASGYGVGVLLARHSDRPALPPDSGRHLWLARTVAGGHILRHAVVESVEVILGWDLRAIGSGRLPAIGRIDTDPYVFMCTHSGRDRCCAVEGRALFNDLLAGTGDREHLWECSHIGGHRFAPVALTLPSGAVHGRLDRASGAELIRRSTQGQVVIDQLRGQSGFPPAFQVAAAAVMREIGDVHGDRLDVLRVVRHRPVPPMPGMPLDPDATAIEAEVRHRDGRAWRADLKQVPLPRPRLESCAKPLVPGTAWECVALTAAASWD